MKKFIILITILLTFSEVQARNLNVKRYEKYSAKYAIHVKDACKKYELDETLVKAVISWESSWSHHVKSNTNCVGLMQVRNGSTDPRKNIFSGVAILKNLFNRYKQKEPNQLDSVIWLKALSAYNLGVTGFNRTRKKHISYATNVMRFKNKIEYLDILKDCKSLCRGNKMKKVHITIEVGTYKQIYDAAMTDLKDDKYSETMGGGRITHSRKVVFHGYEGMELSYRLSEEDERLLLSEIHGLKIEEVQK